MKKRFMQVLLCSMCLFLVAGLMGCSNEHKVESKDKKFSITVPEAWTFNEEAVQDSAPLVVSKKVAEEGSAAVFVTEKGPFSEGKSFDDVSKELQKSIVGEAEESGAKLDTLSEDEIDGKKAKTYESRDDTGNFVISLIEGNENYYMVFVGAEKDEDYDQKAFQKIAESVQIDE